MINPAGISFLIAAALKMGINKFAVAVLLVISVKKETTNAMAKISKMVDIPLRFSRLVAMDSLRPDSLKALPSEIPAPNEN